MRLQQAESKQLSWIEQIPAQPKAQLRFATSEFTKYLHYRASKALQPANYSRCMAGLCDLASPGMLGSVLGELGSQSGAIGYRCRPQVEPALPCCTALPLQLIFFAVARAENCSCCEYSSIFKLVAKQARMAQLLLSVSCQA